MTAHRLVDVAVVEGLVVELAGHPGPGEVNLSTAISELGLGPAGMLILVGELEAMLDIEFPDDLIAALGTVGDLLYFTNVKLEQRIEAVLDPRERAT